MDKDLLLVTSKILGSGHYNAATNLQSGLNRVTDYDINFYDWDFFGGKAYEFMLRNVPTVWHLLNETLQNEFFLGFTKIQDNWNTLTDKTKDRLQKQDFWWQLRYNLFDIESFLRLNEYFEQEGVLSDRKPDWNNFSRIVLTMPGTQSLGYSNYYSDKTYVLVTDYGHVDKAWTVYTPNTFFVANQIAADYLKSFKELESCKIVQTGIPVSSETKRLSQINKKDLRKSLGITAPKFFVLVGGGAGGRSISTMFDLIHKNPLPHSQILVVCGRNELLLKTLKARLKKHPNPQIQLTDYMENDDLLKYYRAADMVITKPGGITLTELINLNTPIGVYYTHPQEEGNLEHVRYGRLGIWNFKPKDFLREVHSLDEDDYDYFSKKMKKVAQYDSVGLIAEHLK